jgi:hypothetical protein
MSGSKRTTVSCAALFLLLVFGSVSVRTQDKDAAQRYLDIEKIGIKWQEGIFGSTSYHERELDALLAGFIGRQIETPYDFVYLLPYERGRTTLSCMFYYSPWVHIRTEIGTDELRKFLSDKKDAESGSWSKSGRMVRITGRLRDFRLDRSFTGKRLILVIDKAALSEDKRYQ